MPKTQPTCQKLTTDTRGKDQKLGGLKGLGGSAGRAEIGLPARLGKRGSTRLEVFWLANTARRGLRRGSAS